LPAPLVLVHGGAGGAWCWEPLLPYLDGDAVAVDLPPKSVRGGPQRYEPLPELRTLTVGDFADSVLRDIDAAGHERFVLVGHSMGGLTVSEIAGREPDRVEHLVYVSCMVPPEGRSAIEALPDDLRAMTRQAVEEARRGGENPIGGLDEETARYMFCNDMEEERTRFVLERLGTEAAVVLAEPVSRAGIPRDTPKTFVKLLDDQSLAPEQQDTLIQNLRDCPGGDVDVITINAGHMVMISRPKELADVLNAIAAAVS
jgi:pimeloyl-ACP methyl ester carboxylesterase